MRDPRHPRHFTEYFKRRIKSINAIGSPRAADNRTPEQNRTLELERENRRLRMEVDVLKQAAPIYARK